MSQVEPSIHKETDRHHDYVKELLLKVRPMPWVENSYSNEDKVTKIAHHFKSILEVLGLDLENPSIKKTPERIAKMYVDDIFKGLESANFPELNLIENDMQYDQMITVKDVEVVSFCEHHFVPFLGAASVAYIPNKKIIGLSKINRIVRFFSQRPQVQERLTKQIGDCLVEALDTKDVAVFIKAKHLCVQARGIRDSQSETVTCDLRGEFRSSPSTRSEFMALCKKERD